LNGGRDDVEIMAVIKLMSGDPVALASVQSPRSGLSVSAPAVRLRNFTRQFGANVILDGLDLDIEEGEFVALLGRSGSGKTTLLRTLAGLDDVTGQDVLVPASRAVVFQDARLLPWKKVWHNVALGLQGADIRQRAEAALQEVGLGHRMDAWPLTLSGGESQRTALARALVREPQLLLLDEPFAALDALTRMKMHGLVLSLWQAHRPAVMMVTHDVDEAMALADRILVLDKGRIIGEEVISAERGNRTSAIRPLRQRLLGHLGVDAAEGSYADMVASPIATN
jgi:sulfonate transport system ATP-binding protein